ncbi:MAG: S-layer homology domain-containing protein [Oscillatoriaceae bacterium SKW80]|nr:S-layer homology domain-containing protein [Oscillatoriaceae bacterium SKYG93]MCX8121431.1 S-layer homology domain-containing protein [Oscillatoriaceae bacterium SKW80]MDW8451892.1 S-layer homology domain-containing protein [Oscillatoriaceae cyanobacterium SKYGB_i_bin93]HIK29435.1 S-layer homology domain-containing protein [Oscillatoriaceae cyanobacterium M7585_C2015_266]
MPIIYVNPAIGSDKAAGTQSAPLKTITKALERAQFGTIIQLAAGTYSAANGERFPLIVPSGVSIIGDEAKKGSNIIIEGSGEFISPTFSRQNITIRLENESQLRGITVSNRATSGTAVWVESTNPTIANNTFTKSEREGIFITGTAQPIIANNIFTENLGNGISLVRNAKGEIRGNIFKKTGYGLAIGEKAAPLVRENQISENRVGIVINGESRPVLRKNIIEKNLQDGIVVTMKSLPDLGWRQDPGGNIIRENRQYDLQNATSNVLVSVGNLLNPARVKGLVDFANNEIPGEPTPSPTPIPPPPKPTPAPSPIPIPVPAPPAGLKDINGHWAQVFIQRMVEKGLISGFPDGMYKPEYSITRAEYAAMVAKTFQVERKKAAIAFKDIPENYWAAAAIRKATEMGFIAGFPDGTFRPKDNLTRVQALVSLVNGLGLVGGNPNSLFVYSDRALIPSYAIDEIATATEKRLVVNYPQVNRLNPMRGITRAEVAAIVYQGLVAIGKAEAISSPYIVNSGSALPIFSDIQNHWASEFITALAIQGVVSGFSDGTFQPDTTMTRAQYAAFLARSFDLKQMAKQPVVNFTDVPANLWAAEAIKDACRAKFLTGFPDGTFRPNENISRLQVIVSLVNGLGLTTESTEILQVLEDCNQLPEWAKKPVAAALTHKLVVNYPNRWRLNPNQYATRAEVTAMLYQQRVSVGASAQISSPYIVAV